MLRSLVGSEMCIRDRYNIDRNFTSKKLGFKKPTDNSIDCLLYTSDAADDTPCVDLGGRRIIKKKEVFLKEIIKILDDNKAKDIVTIDLANKSSIADYMIVASGTSSRHIQSVSENTIEELKKMGIKGCKVEGRDSDNWKLIDAIDVIVHIFHHEQRKNYELEKMWADIIPNQKIFV